MSRGEAWPRQGSLPESGREPGVPHGGPGSDPAPRLVRLRPNPPVEAPSRPPDLVGGGGNPGVGPPDIPLETHVTCRSPPIEVLPVGVLPGGPCTRRR